VPIESGQQLLHYRLTEKIGEGGMGVVWRAVDSSLDREVAIKVLPDALAQDAERLARFQHEAKSLASLNHPNIAAIHSVHEADGLRFLAMELVPREDLSQRIARGPVPLDEAVEIARQIASALTAAHDAGIVHRDLKPANVKLSPDGKVKVLDFGLAKAIVPGGATPGSAAADSSLSPTATSLGTIAGTILGTAAYMSPEQARGRAVDKRADLWALGGVLFEMLTRTAPFPGETISDTLAAVLKSEPEWDRLPANTPPAVRRLLRRCLEKDPEHRLHDAADARIELEHAFDEAGETPAAPASRFGAGGYGVALLATALVAVVVGYAVRGLRLEDSAPAAGRIVSSIEAPAGVRLGVAGLSLALSPNGEELAFVGIDADGRSHLYLRRLDSDAARRVEGTESAVTPFWSPDGREVGFFADTGLMRVATAGGAPRLLTDRTGVDGSWSPNGTILFGARQNEALGRIDAEGGPVEIIASTDLGPGIQVFAPQFLADGEHYIVKVEDLEGDRSGIYLGDLESSELTLLLPGLTNAAYAEGQLLFFQDENLMAQPFDPNAGRLSGEPRRIAGPVLKTTFPYIGHFSVSARGGRLVHLAGVQDAGLSEMVWVDREGNELERTGIIGDLYNPRLTQDGRRLAVDISTRTTHGDIWVFDLARGSSRRLTRHEVDESRPVWLPGEEQLAFFRIPDLYVIEANGRGEPELLYENEFRKWVVDITLDGRWGLVGQPEDGIETLHLFDFDSGEMKAWQEDVFDGRVSPDGRWVAYASAESGSVEIYLERFPEHGERFQVSDGAAGWPVWHREGKEIYYVSASRDLMAVSIDMNAPSDPVGRPVKLFRPRLGRENYFDVGPDSRRFLITQRIDPELSSVVLVQNWTGSRLQPP
jgi:Tol biopolymer transport system component